MLEGMKGQGTASIFLVVFSLRWLPVFRRNFKVWRKLMGPALLGNILEPLFYLLALGYGLGRFIGEMQGMDYVTFLASGFVCASAMNTASFEGLYSAYTRMAVQRTWESMLMAPLRLEDIILGEIIWAGTKSLISASIILLVAILLNAVHGWEVLLAVPMFMLLGLCFAVMALIVTALSRSYDFFMYYFTLVVTPMYLFSGVFFPLDDMPGLIQQISGLLPLTHGVAIVRPLLTGHEVDGLVQHLLVLFAYLVFAYWLAVLLLKRRLIV